MMLITVQDWTSGLVALLLILMDDVCGHYGMAIPGIEGRSSIPVHCHQHTNNPRFIQATFYYSIQGLAVPSQNLSFPAWNWNI